MRAELHPQLERDRRKDGALPRAGQRVVRFTWRLVIGEPAEVVATLRAAGASLGQWPTVL